MFQFPHSRPPHRAASGFSLVEIMVGMVIGMLGLIIMMQVFTLSEGQKRATTGGGDAQSSATIALFGLQRDLRQAGYGVGDPKLLGCSVLLRAGVTLTAMAPLTINHGSIPAGDANTDTLLLVYGNSNSSPQGDEITSQPLTGVLSNGSAPPDIYNVNAPTSFTTGDMVIATPLNRATPCNLILTGISGVRIDAGDNVTVTAGTGVAGMQSGSTLFNLGQAPKLLAYAVRGGNLTLCDYMVNDCSNAANTGNAAIWVPIANNIVSLRAQYGRDTMLGLTPLDTTMDGIVDWYDQTTPFGPSAVPATPEGTAQPAPPMNAAAAGPSYACAFARIPAVRLALVARDANFDKTVVTAAAPTWDGSTAHTPPNPPTALDSIGWAADPIDLSGNAIWQNFRYRLVQTVVPLRNLAWQGVPTGC